MGPAAGQRAQALVEERLESAQRAVGGEGTAGAGADADGREEIVVLPLLELLAPLGRGHTPRGKVEDAGWVAAADVRGGT